MRGLFGEASSTSSSQSLVPASKFPAAVLETLWQRGQETGVDVSTYALLASKGPYENATVEALQRLLPVSRYDRERVEAGCGTRRAIIGGADAGSGGATRARRQSPSSSASPGVNGTPSTFWPSRTRPPAVPRSRTRTEPSVASCSDDGTVKLADFGMTFDDRSKPDPNKIIPFGTWEYMAPECWKRKLGEPGFASDVFSFGMMLWEMFARVRIYKT